MSTAFSTANCPQMHSISAMRRSSASASLVGASVKAPSPRSSTSRRP
jgi:hypothetical protein